MGNSTSDSIRSEMDATFRDRVERWKREMCGEEFRLESANFEFTSEPFFEAVKGNCTVKHMNLSGIGIGVSGSKALTEALKVDSVPRINTSNYRMNSPRTLFLAEALEKNSTLCELNLSNNEIDSFAALEPLAKSLRVNSTLRELNLSGNSIDSSGSRALGEALKVNSSICELNLHGNKIDSSGFQALLAGLKNNSTLQKLILSSNEIGSLGSRDSIETLKMNSTLRELDLSGNNIDSSASQALGEVLKVNSSLRELNLTGNKIGSSGSQALGEALKVNCTLQKLILGETETGSLGAHALAEGVKVNSTLDVLDLSENQIDHVGAYALGDALKHNTTLQKLILRGNQINSEGAHLLAEALRTNSSLHDLDLARNMIDSVGIAAISESLNENSTLRRLNLDENTIGSFGARALSETLRKNSSLTDLSLSDTDIDCSGAQFLSEALRVNSTLRALHLENNLIETLGALSIAATLRINSSLEFLNLLSNNYDSVGEQALRDAVRANETPRQVLYQIFNFRRESHKDNPVHSAITSSQHSNNITSEVLNTNRKRISKKLSELKSECVHWVTMKARTESPANHETFTELFPVLYSTLLSLLDISSIDSTTLQDLRAISSTDTLAQDLLHFLPLLRELYEWMQDHDSCRSLCEQVKSMQEKLKDAKDDVQRAKTDLRIDSRKSYLSPYQRTKAETHVERLNEEVHSLRYSVEERLQKLWNFPKEVYGCYTQELEQSLTQSDASDNSAITRMVNKLVYHGVLLQRDFNEDYEVLEALDRTSTTMRATLKRMAIEEVILKKLPFNSPAQHDMAWNELNHLLTLQNRPYIVELNGAFIQQSLYGHDLILEMPFCRNGNLMHWLKKEEYNTSADYDAHGIRRKETKRSEHEIHWMFLQIAEAVGEIHSLGIEHRDLKPEHILIEGSGSLARVKLIDFGIGKDSSMSFSTTMKTANGVNVQMTTRYAPPERKFPDGSGNTTTSSSDAAEVEGSWDMYSLGVILYEMLCAPEDVSRIDTLSATNVAASQVLRSRSGLLDEWSFSLVKSLLSRNPTDRSSASIVCLRMKQRIFDSHSAIRSRSMKNKSTSLNLLAGIQASVNTNKCNRFVIRRSHMVSDTLSHFKNQCTRENLLLTPMVKYENESGHGSGVFRDLCTQVMRQLFKCGDTHSDSGAMLLEVDTADGWQFFSPVDGRDVRREMESLGRLVFYCLALSHTLRLQFSPLVYCALVGQIPETETEWMDILRPYDSSITHIEPQLQSLHSSERGMAISIFDAKKKSLKGSKHRMKNIQHFCEGFTSCMKPDEKEVLYNLSWRDARFLCAGNEVISPETVISVMKESLHEDVWESSEEHRNTSLWFQEWIRKQDSDGLRLLLGFCTGLNTLPVDLSRFRIRVIPKESFAQSSTCFNEILIGTGCGTKGEFFSMMDSVIENYDIEGQRQLED